MVVNKIILKDFLLFVFNLFSVSNQDLHTSPTAFHDKVYTKTVLCWDMTASILFKQSKDFMQNLMQAAS